MTDIKSDFYNKDYYENGLILGCSGYSNYRWIPELTIPMAYHIVKGLDITPEARILDYGCAKGYLVSAFRLLGFNALGIDISDYAIENSHEISRDFCWKVTQNTYKQANLGKFTHIISKDVFEHIPEDELDAILSMLADLGQTLFSIIPLATDDINNKFIIDSYHNDLSHITIKSRNWWENLISKHFSKTIFSELSFNGCKTNWTSKYPDGNLFFYASK